MKVLAYLSGGLRVSTDPSAVMGGPRSHVLGTISGFRSLGWEVRSYIAGDRGWGRRLGGDGSEERVRSAPWRAMAADGVRLTAAAWNAFEVDREIRPERPDLIYERFASFQAIGRRLGRSTGAPWVLETSGPFFHEAKVERRTLAFGSLARRRELKAYRECDLLVCVSEPLVTFLVDEGVPRDHMMVVPNGVDVVRFAPREPADEHRPSSFRIGFVGTAHAWQGLSLLVEAVHVARSRGLDVVAEIVGAGNAIGDVAVKVEELGLHDAVHLAGQVPGDQIPSRIAAFDVGFAGHIPLLAGTMYHSPLKLYEYMAMGKPVLASAYPDATKLVDGSGFGYLFEPADLDSLVTTIERAVADVDRARRSASEIAAYIQTHHSWRRRVEDLLAELARRGLA